MCVVVEALQHLQSFHYFCPFEPDSFADCGRNIMSVRGGIESVGYGLWKDRGTCQVDLVRV